MTFSLRQVFGLVLVALALLALGVAVGLHLGGQARHDGPAPRAAPERPAASPSVKPIPRALRSVLLVTLDTTRADRLGPYGAADVATPALEHLANQGVLFARASAVAPLTLPAHTSVHTGLYPFQHGVRNNGIHHAGDQLTTLAERLRAQGYRTGAFVSAAVLERRFGLDQGFEHYDDDLSTSRLRHPRMVADRPAEFTAAAAAAWLDALAPRQRFFAWVHFYDPHAAYAPPPPYRDRYRERLYDGEIAYMDAQLGRLLAHPRLDPAQETVVLVLGDHGESLGEHGEQTHALLAYESTLHVPFLLRVPGGPRGRRVGVPVSQIDVVPTLLALLGLPADPALPGQDLTPLLEGTRAPRRAGLYAEAYLPFYTYGWAKLKVFRRGNWKYVDAPTPELFDLERDPNELANLARQRPDMAHDLRRDLADLLARSGDAEREAELKVSGEVLERLRGLGYLAMGSAPRDAGQARPDPKDMIHLHVALERARTLLRDRLFAAAERTLARVLDEDPGNLAALVETATALREQGKLDAAVETVARALEIDPGYARLHLAMASLEAQRGNLAQALSLVDGALAIDPDHVGGQLQKVTLLLRLRRRAAAKALLEQVLAQHPRHVPANVQYAQRFELPGGDLAGAEARLRRALARDPFAPAAWRVLGEALERAGRRAEATEAYRSGLRRQPDDAELHARLGLLLVRRSPALPGDVTAERHLREAIRLSAGYRSELHVSLGAWLATRGRYAEAENQYEKVLTVEPDNPGARNNRAVAYYHTDRVAQAEQDLQALVEQFPDHPDAHNNLAAIAVDRGDWDDAERHARQAAALGSAPDPWNNLGIALDEQGRLDEAVESFRKSLRIDPGYWRARLNLGIALRKQGAPRAAEAELKKVLSLFPNEAATHFELGALYEGPLRDHDRARIHLNAFLRVSPAHPAAAEVRRRVAALDPPGGGG